MTQLSSIRQSFRKFFDGRFQVWPLRLLHVSLQRDDRRERHLRCLIHPPFEIEPAAKIITIELQLQRFYLILREIAEALERPLNFLNLHQPQTGFIRLDE